MSETKSSSSGLGLGTVLFLIFLVLKLTDKIDWSWWWITSPLWIPILLGMIIGGFIVFLKAIVDRH